MKRFLYVFIFLYSCFIQGQNIEGRLIDMTDGAPIDGAFIAMLTKLDQTFITSTYTENNGYFSINRMTNDSLFLSVRAIGYKDTIITLPFIQVAELKLGDIPLRNDTNILLDEVVVTAKPYTLRKSTDRIIMSLTGKNELVKNNSILGVLRYSPMLKVDEVQGISMIGKKNIAIYINGRKTTMSSSEVQNYLNSISASNVKSIELITNPGSQFDISAKTGILNINLRKNEDEGLKGFASAQMWQTHYNKQIASLNLNYAKSNFSMRTAFTARNLADWSKSEDAICFPLTNLVTERNSMSKNRRQLYQGNVDLSVAMNKKQTFGAVLDFSLWDGTPRMSSISRYKDLGTENTDSILWNNTKSNMNTGRLAINLNYMIKFDSKSSLAIDADYQHYRQRQRESFESYRDLDGDISDGYTQRALQDNDLLMSKAEYIVQLKKDQKITLGVNGYSSISPNKNEYEKQYVLSSLYSDNQFDYKERSVAGYMSYEDKWSERISASIGLRYEHTFVKGHLKYPQEEQFVKKYSDWYPSLSITYIPVQQLYFWYSFTTQNTYPMYEYLNPYKKYQTTTSYSTGNPYLRPSSTYYQELGSYINNKYMIILSYYITKDATTTFTQVEHGNTEVTFPINYGRETGMNLNVNVNQSLIKDRWFLNATMMGQYMHYRSIGYEELKVDKGYFYGEINIDNTFILSKKYSWKLLCNYQFRTSRRELTEKSESDMRGSVEMRKDIKNWSLAFSYYRSFNYNNGKYSSQRESSYITPYMERQSLSVGEYQGLMLKVSYNWGNKKVKNGKKHNPISENQRERYSGNK